MEPCISCGQVNCQTSFQGGYHEIQNDKFHEEFDALEKASEAGDKKVVKDQTHELLDACVVCHERFKK
jgi:cytochrome c556